MKLKKIFVLKFAFALCAPLCWDHSLPGILCVPDLCPIPGCALALWCGIGRLEQSVPLGGRCGGTGRVHAARQIHRHPHPKYTAVRDTALYARAISKYLLCRVVVRLLRLPRQAQAPDCPLSRAAVPAPTPSAPPTSASPTPTAASASASIAALGSRRQELIGAGRQRAPRLLLEAALESLQDLRAGTGCDHGWHTRHRFKLWVSVGRKATSEGQRGCDSGHMIENGPP